MIFFSDCPGVLSACFGVLTNLLNGTTDQAPPLPPYCFGRSETKLNGRSETKLNGAFIRFSIEMGGIEMILEAMKKFPDYERLQYVACALLSNLAMDRGVCNRIKEAKACGSVGIALDNRSGNQKIASVAKNFFDQMLRCAKDDE